MPHDWMIHVLADIREFAQQRAMYELAEHLDDAIMIASEELSAGSETPNVTSMNDAPNGRPLESAAIVTHN